MTTTVKVHVNGDYITTVRKTNRKTGEVTEDTIDATGANGGVERSYSLGHPAEADFTISERYNGQTQTEGLSQAADHLGDDQSTQQTDAGANRKPNMFD